MVGPLECPILKIIDESPQGNVYKNVDKNNGRRTDISMARRKRTKRWRLEKFKIPNGVIRSRKSIQRQTIHRKLKIEQHEPHWSNGCSQMLRKSRQFLFHMWSPSCYKPGSMLWMRKIPYREHIRGHLCHRYSVTINHVMERSCLAS